MSPQAITRSFVPLLLATDISLANPEMGAVPEVVERRVSLRRGPKANDRGPAPHDVARLESGRTGTLVEKSQLIVAAARAVGVGRINRIDDDESRLAAGGVAEHRSGPGAKRCRAGARLRFKNRQVGREACQGHRVFLFEFLAHRRIVGDFQVARESRRQRPARRRDRQEDLRRIVLLDERRGGQRRIRIGRSNRDLDFAVGEGERRPGGDSLTPGWCLLMFGAKSRSASRRSQEKLLTAGSPRSFLNGRRRLG